MEEHKGKNCPVTEKQGSELHQTSFQQQCKQGKSGVKYFKGWKKKIINPEFCSSEIMLQKWKRLREF